MSGRDLIELYLSDDGAYAGANDVGRDVLGYTDDELAGLPLGALSGSDRDGARRTWRGFTAGDVQPLADVLGQLEAKDGSIVTVRHLGTERRSDGAGWVSRSVVLATSHGSDDEASTLASLLAEWRQADRVLADMADDDPRQPAAQRRLAECRERYSAASAEREVMRV